MYYLLVTLVGSTVFFGVVPAAVIFILAGRWDLWNVWAYAGILVVFFSFATLATYRSSPDLLKERMKPATPGRAGWTGVPANSVVFLLHWSIAGLDQRFHWSDIVPPAGVAAGLVIIAIGVGLATWATVVNPFYSSVIRIQADRGQRVISEGPYAIVRHPSYAAGILAFVGSGVALNSLLSITPIVVILLPLFIYRTMIEDRLLQDELAGYADYAAKVRYRLIPSVW